MNEFGIGRAWSLGVDFIKRSPSGHAVLLVLIGTIVPTIIQFGLVGGTASLTNPTMFGQNAPFALASGGAAMLAAMVAGYVFQTGGYFGSWRLGLARSDLGAAIGYGLTAGILAVLAGAALGAVGLGFSQAVGIAGLLLVLVLAMPLLASLYSLMVAMMAVFMLLAGLFMALFGVALGSAAPASGAFGAGLIGGLVILALSVLLLWLAARFSCTTSVMASEADFNLFGALGESWRLTGRAQVRIMLYLALVGFLFGLVLVVFGAGLAASAVSELASGGGMQGTGFGMILFSVVISALMGYVSVLVPAGIFRALKPDADASAAIFD